MGLVDSLKGFMGMDDDFYDEEYDDVYEDEYEEDKTEKPKSRFTRRTDNVVNMPGDGSEKSIAIMKAKKYEDAAGIAEILKSRRPVIFDVGDVEMEGDAEKIVDFMSGAVFGLNGDIKRVSGGIFIAVPANMDITNEDLRRNVKGSVKFDF